MANVVDATRLAVKYDIGNMPGYLSYPVVTKWTQPITPEQVVDICARPGAGDDAYVYFHFPYCETLCYYCACYMAVTAKPGPRYNQYLAALDQELALKCARRTAPLTVGEMHWGGGTPTYMDCGQIERAFHLIEQHVEWKPGATLSVEAYPDSRTLTVEKLQLLRSLGFSQLSFGIESLDPRVLKAINRRHDLASIRYWVEHARALDFGVHVDLVYGLPYQTADSLRSTIEGLMTVAPDRVATFQFMYTPMLIRHQQVIPADAVPGSEERLRLYQVLQDLEAYGFTRVGCDHWVRGRRDPLAAAAERGDIIYHFQGYEPLTRRHFLGFGSSAISFVDDRYFKNTGSTADYIATLGRGQIPVDGESSAALGAAERLRHHVIMKSIMSDLRIDKDDVARRFGIDFDDHFAKELSELRDMEADGLLTGVDGNVVTITPLGRAFIRNIARVFDTYRSMFEGARRLSLKRRVN